MKLHFLKYLVKSIKMINALLLELSSYCEALQNRDADQMLSKCCSTIYDAGQY